MTPDFRSKMPLQKWPFTMALKKKPLSHGTPPRKVQFPEGLGKNPGFTREPAVPVSHPQANGQFVPNREPPPEYYHRQMRTESGALEFLKIRVLIDHQSRIKIFAGMRFPGLRRPVPNEGLGIYISGEYRIPSPKIRNAIFPSRSPENWLGEEIRERI